MKSTKQIARWLPFGQVAELSAEELHNQMDQGQVQIIDVRTRQEWLSSRIPGAINLAITHFSKSNIESLNLDKKIPTVAICLSAHRSIPAVRQLHQLGFENCQQLKGGMRSWWKNDLPTTTGQ